MNIKAISNCDLCNSNLLSAVYQPLQSRYSTEVYLCEECGLVQSQKNSIPNEAIKTTSADADWGNVRHGKGLRFEVLRNKLDLEKLACGRVLDIGSNRGDFVNWAISMNRVSKVVAVEPDNTLMSDYVADIVLYNAKLEDVNFENDKFDFIYCCQTLEHADSAFEMLKKLRGLLKTNGKALIDIPNIDIIKKDETIEEFFIDKHSFHFDESTILKYFSRLGLKTCAFHGDQYNLAYLVEACEAQPATLPLNKLVTHEDFAKYQKNLLINRSNLNILVRSRMEPVLERQKCAIWGAGRTLDALIKFGSLKIDTRITIVDSYLHDKIKIIDEYQICKPSFLKIVEPQVVFILANSAEDQLAQKAYKMGIRHVIKFSEMLDQI